jgi:predicted nuclease of restriction endonuclease-like (RecB) superfamily
VATSCEQPQKTQTIMSKNNIKKSANSSLFSQVKKLIESAKTNVVIFVNAKTTMLYWQIGNHINSYLKQGSRAAYGKEILSTLSQELTANYGKGYSYSALTRMSKMADIFDRKIIATLSQQFSWSHFIELSAIEDETKRYFYTEMCKFEKWSVRTLRDQVDRMLYERTAISKKPKNLIKKELKQLAKEKKFNPDLVFKDTYVLDFLGLKTTHREQDLEDAIISNIEEFLLEMGSGFTFIARQKRINVDAVDYYLDLLFYHRKLQRLVAIDLKLGKFKPEYKGQMELYLRWLQKNEQQKNEKNPLGLLLCSEGNSEHIEFLMLNQKDVKVAQYLVELPTKKWFIEKLHQAVEQAKFLSSN